MNDSIKDFTPIDSSFYNFNLEELSNDENGNLFTKDTMNLSNDFSKKFLHNYYEKYKNFKCYNKLNEIEKRNQSEKKNSSFSIHRPKKAYIKINKTRLKTK